MKLSEENIKDCVYHFGSEVFLKLGKTYTNHTGKDWTQWIHWNEEFPCDKDPGNGGESQVTEKKMTCQCQCRSVKMRSHLIGTTGMGCERVVCRREIGDFDKHIESFWASLKSGKIGIKQWPFSHYKIGKILNGDIIRKKDTFYMIRWSINESSQ